MDHRTQVCLYTPNHREAARKAAELYAKIVSDGWETGLADYRPIESLKGSASSTIGNLIEAASKLSSVRPQTLKVYAQAFRCLVAEITGITSANKNDFGKGGTEAWRQEVDAVKLDSFTPADVVVWKNKRIRSKGEDPLTKKARRRPQTPLSVMREDYLAGKSSPSSDKRSLCLIH